MSEYRVCSHCGLTVFAMQETCPSCGAGTIPEPAPALIEEWHEKREGICCDCGAKGRVRRLVRAKGYNARTKIPEFRCASCSEKKLAEVRARGIPV